MGFTGGGQRNTGNMFITLKALSQRKISADEVIARLRKKLIREPGAKLYLQASQDIRMGGRQSNAQYQYTLQADDLNVLREWTPKLFKALETLPQLADVNSDQQDKGMQTSLVYDRDTMSRLQITPAVVDSTLNDAFGQRQISTIYNPLNQYHVVMEAAQRYLQNTDSCARLTWIRPPEPLCRLRPSAPTAPPRRRSRSTIRAVRRATISFNLPIGTSLGQASEAIEQTSRKIGMPDTVHGNFQGTARAFQDSHQQPDHADSHRSGDHLHRAGHAV